MDIVDGMEIDVKVEDLFNIMQDMAPGDTGIYICPNCFMSHEGMKIRPTRTIQDGLEEIGMPPVVVALYARVPFPEELRGKEKEILICPCGRKALWTTLQFMGAYTLGGPK